MMGRTRYEDAAIILLFLGVVAVLYDTLHASRFLREPLFALAALIVAVSASFLFFRSSKLAEWVRVPASSVRRWALYWAIWLAAIASSSWFGFYRKGGGFLVAGLGFAIVLRELLQRKRTTA